MSIISIVTVSLPNTDIFIRYACGGLPELEGTTGLPGRLVLVVVVVLRRGRRGKYQAKDKL